MGFFFLSNNQCQLQKNPSYSTEEDYLIPLDGEPYGKEALRRCMERFAVKRGLEKKIGGNAGLARIATTYFDDIQVDAEWLVCKDVCIPESAQLSTTVVVDDLPVQSDSFFTIQRLRQQIPTTLEKPLLYSISDQWMEIQIPRQTFTGSKVFDFFP